MYSSQCITIASLNWLSANHELFDFCLCARMAVSRPFGGTVELLSEHVDENTLFARVADN